MAAADVHVVGPRGDLVGQVLGSELLREALRRHPDRLASEDDADRWETAPLDDGERVLGEIADWGPADDWSDWAVDAAR